MLKNLKPTLITAENLKLTLIAGDSEQFNLKSMKSTRAVSASNAHPLNTTMFCNVMFLVES